jgi:hypothetical protein
MLTSEMLDDWAAALRSGEYEQTRVELKQDGKHCCLGVACVVWNLDIKNGYNELEYLGLDTVYQSIFWNMNDTERKTFSEIADYIDKNKKDIIESSIPENNEVYDHDIN